MDLALGGSEGGSTGASQVAFEARKVGYDLCGGGVEFSFSDQGWWMKEAPQYPIVPNLMTRRFEVVEPSASVSEAARLMIANRLLQVLVVDDDRVLLGVVEHHDIVQRLCVAALYGEEELTKFWQMPVSSLMQPGLALAFDAPLEEVYRLLCGLALDGVPVTDSRGRAVGILESVQLVRSVLSQSTGQVEQGFRIFRRGASQNQRKLPAFFRRGNGCLVLPLSSLNGTVRKARHALLGYDSTTDRILVQLLEHEMADSIPIGRGSVRSYDDYFEIPASDFLKFFGLEANGQTYEIHCDADEGIILTPRHCAVV